MNSPPYVPAKLEKYKDTNPIVYALLSQKFPNHILNDFQLPYLGSPLQMINSFVYAQAENPRFKPKKEKLYGPEIMYFVDYLH